ncbi:MAG: AAA family ATPase [Gammaproteobacteria bacterium]|nr:AAA family ATPase [Gammaproteobacteria bacterium]
MLLIRRIEITNFACFDHIEISPSANPARPLTVIRAENGSGKTTLLRDPLGHVWRKRPSWQPRHLLSASGRLAT